MQLKRNQLTIEGKTTKLRIEKKYGNSSGRRFAQVHCDFFILDVCVRKNLNDSEETRTGRIYEQAVEKYLKEKKNP